MGLYLPLRLRHLYPLAAARQLTYTRGSYQDNIHQETPTPPITLNQDSLPIDGRTDTSENSGGPTIRYVSDGDTAQIQRQARKEALGIDVLGGPANIFIIEPEEKKKRIRAFVLEAENTNDGARELDETEILQRVEDERGIIDPEEACRNIDEVRHAWMLERGNDHGYVTDDEYKSLAGKLTAGFTRVQLQVYLAQNEQKSIDDGSGLEQSHVSRIFTRSSWRAGTTPIADTRAPPFCKMLDETHPNTVPNQHHIYDKHDLVENILRKAWHVYPSSRELELGELEIRLQPHHFGLIMRHRRFGSFLVF